MNDEKNLSELELEKLKYPTGKFQYISSEKDLADFISVIESFPSRLRKEVEHLNDEQLKTTYRPEGWTVKQVVHHCADSHINGYVRMKLALTETEPTIKPYFEDRWAKLADYELDINISLYLLDALHKRWVVLLKNLSDEDLTKKFIHPDNNKIFTLDEHIAHYSWHCNHHLSHITSLKKRRGWE